MIKNVIIAGLSVAVVVLAYEEFNEVGPDTQVVTPTKQIVPIGQQPKDPTKPWCYEQKSGNGTVIVCH